MRGSEEGGGPVLHWVLPGGCSWGMAAGGALPYAMKEEEPLLWSDVPMDFR